MRFLKSRADAASLALVILLKKLFFYFIFLYIPLQLLSFEPFLIVSLFLTMLVVAGITLTIIFQLAHVVPHCEAESSPANLVNKNWHVYQLQTTCDFAHGNKLVSYLIGGLNYQVEHHLFPHVCHVHYPAISSIVKQTATEFGVPYHYEETFLGAIKAHYRQLKELGSA
jgi:linoleoyl-CoA desaturase